MKSFSKFCEDHPLLITAHPDEYKPKEIIKRIMKDSFGIKRKDMPQIKSKDTNDFLVWLKSESIPYSRGIINPSKLRAVQSEFDFNKIGTMMSEKDFGSKPIIISSDDYVVDGNHRWISSIFAHRDVKFIKVGMPIAKLLGKIAKDYHA